MKDLLIDGSLGLVVLLGIVVPPLLWLSASLRKAESLPEEDFLRGTLQDLAELHAEQRRLHEPPRRCRG